MEALMITLRIATGMHAGAELRLGPGEYIIGSDETSCDIVLFDAEVQPQHAVLEVAVGAKPRIRPLTGARVSYEGKEHADAAFEVECEGQVTIGSCAVALVWDASQTAAPEPDIRFAPTMQAEPVAAAPEPLPVPPVRKAWQRAGWASATMAGVGITFALVLNSLSSRATTESGNVADVERVLASMHYRELDVRRSPGGEIVVSGYIASRADRDRLEAALRKHSPNGVRLQVVPIGSARTYDAGMPASPALAATSDKKSVLIDGSGGLAMRTKATRSAADEGEIQLQVRGVRVDDGGERILETADGRRYTVGAVLPGGYTVIQLEEDHIVLLKGRDRFMYSLAKPAEPEEVPEVIGS
jgi:hypothetical protein